jgi:Ser-tRNA(Ala) deacylase AlaX
MVGEDVDCQVDEQRRMVNTRLHSGGHLLDMAIDQLGLSWNPTKAQHYIDLSAIEYSGEWDESKTEELRSAIEHKSNELISAIKNENRILFTPAEQMHTVCKHVPTNIPTNKPSRVVIYGENFGIPCGGTHVRNLADIGEVQISKIKCKKGVIRINYEIVGINDK